MPSSRTFVAELKVGLRKKRCFAFSFRFPFLGKSYFALIFLFTFPRNSGNEKRNFVSKPKTVVIIRNFGQFYQYINTFFTRFFFAFSCRSLVFGGVPLENRCRLHFLNFHVYISVSQKRKRWETLFSRFFATLAQRQAGEHEWLFTGRK